MNEFVSLPLTTTQITDEPIDPDFSVMPDTEIDPDFSVMPPDYSVIDPDFSVTPPDYPVIDPDFSVTPPVYPVNPPYIPTPSPVIPCLFCNNNQWIRGGIRLLNAATGYNAFSVFIDGRPAFLNLSFPQITQYRQYSQGYHTFTVRGTNGYTYVQKSMYIGDGMATIAIINAASGVDLTQIEDTACPTSNNTACFRICNLAYYTGAVNAAMGNVYFNVVNFKTATSFSPFEAGNYTLNVSRSVRPETTLVTTQVTLIRRRIYTAFVLNWNTAPDTVQTLLVEDRRN